MTKNSFYYAELQQLLERCLPCGFLFPQAYAGCTHDYIPMDSGFCVCRECGDMHICCQGKCPETVVENSGRVCTITGCVTVACEMRPERNAGERVTSMKKVSLKQHVKNYQQGQNMTSMTATHLWETIETVVVELLSSDKTKSCAMQERERYEGKENSYFSKIVRDLSQNKKTNNVRPNMLQIMSTVYFGCKKHRILEEEQPYEMREIQKQCTESIMCLIRQYGWVRVWRQLQNQTRGREFICSMLYLMRMGITYQKRQILPKMAVLNSLLPMQALLPTVFKIRAKSITEGENIIKLDIRRVAC